MATTAIPDVLRNYLMSCSEDMASEIMSALQQAGRRVAPNAATGMTVTNSAVAKPEKKQRKKAKSDLEIGGPKRPLNSWMAFRKYYNRMLAKYTQKAISKCLTQFWRQDPFTGKWAILAKAYSVVRGSREKKEVPLDEFFAICAPLIGIIPPNEYLQYMGWQVLPPQDGDEEQMPQIIRLFTPTALPEKFMTTTLSVDDLVNHCYAQGYVNTSDNDSPNMSTQGLLTMVSKPSAITTNDMVEATHMTPFAQTDADLAFNAATPNSSMDEELHQAMLGELASSPLAPAINVGPLPFAVAPAAGQATLEQAASALELSGIEFPYNGAFDFELPGQFEVSFNPSAPDTTVEDDGRWDAFETSSVMQLGEMHGSFDEMLPWADLINDDQ